MQRKMQRRKQVGRSKVPRQKKLLASIEKRKKIVMEQINRIDKGGKTFSAAQLKFRDRKKIELRILDLRTLLIDLEKRHSTLTRDEKTDFHLVHMLLQLYSLQRLPPTRFRNKRFAQGVYGLITMAQEVKELIAVRGLMKPSEVDWLSHVPNQKPVVIYCLQTPNVQFIPKSGFSNII